MQKRTVCRNQPILPFFISAICVVAFPTGADDDALCSQQHQGLSESAREAVKGSIYLQEDFHAVTRAARLDVSPTASSNYSVCMSNCEKLANAKNSKDLPDLPDKSTCMPYCLIKDCDCAMQMKDRCKLGSCKGCNDCAAGEWLDLQSICKAKCKDKLPILQLAFVVDCTGSTQPYIDSLKDAVLHMGEAFASVVDTLEVSFLCFRDEVDGANRFVWVKENDGSKWFTKLDEFKAKLDSVVATGGGDAPEDIAGGIGEALLHDLPWMNMAGGLKVIAAISKDPDSKRTPYQTASAQCQLMKDVKVAKIDLMFVHLAKSDPMKKNVAEWRSCYDDTGVVNTADGPIKEYQLDEIDISDFDKQAIGIEMAKAVCEILGRKQRYHEATLTASPTVLPTPRPTAAPTRRPTAPTPPPPVCGDGYELQGSTSSYEYCNNYQPGSGSPATQEISVSSGIAGVAECKIACDSDSTCTHFGKYGVYCDGACSATWETRCFIIRDCGGQKVYANTGAYGAVYCKKSVLPTALPTPLPTAQPTTRPTATPTAPPTPPPTSPPTAIPTSPPTECADDETAMATWATKTCAAHKAAGNCDKAWFAAKKYCEETCGRCPDPCGDGYELQGSTSSYEYCNNYQPGSGSPATQEISVSSGIAGVAECKIACDSDSTCTHFGKYGVYCDGACSATWETRCFIIRDCGGQKVYASTGAYGAVYCKKSVLPTALPTPLPTAQPTTCQATGWKTNMGCDTSAANKFPVSSTSTYLKLSVPTTRAECEAQCTLYFADKPVAEACCRWYKALAGTHHNACNVYKTSQLNYGFDMESTLFDACAPLTPAPPTPSPGLCAVKTKDPADTCVTGYGYATNDALIKKRCKTPFQLDGSGGEPDTIDIQDAAACAARCDSRPGECVGFDVFKRNSGLSRCSLCQDLATECLEINGITNANNDGVHYFQVLGC